MAVQLLQPLPDVLAAVAAVLRPGGRFVATMPTSRALTVRDKLCWLELVATLRTHLRYPNDALLDGLPQLLDRVSLFLAQDEHRRFALPIRGITDARQLVSSLYLSGVDADARARAVTVVAGWGDDIGISIRRIVALRSPNE
jgi:hypothetical protein